MYYPCIFLCSFHPNSVCYPFRHCHHHKCSQSMQCTSEGVDLVPELVPASCSILGGHKLSNAANQVLSTFFALRRRIRGGWDYTYGWILKMMSVMMIFHLLSGQFSRSGHLSTKTRERWLESGSVFHFIIIIIMLRWLNIDGDGPTISVRSTNIWCTTCHKCGPEWCAPKHLVWVLFWHISTGANKIILRKDIPKKPSGVLKISCRVQILQHTWSFCMFLWWGCES